MTNWAENRANGNSLPIGAAQLNLLAGRCTGWRQTTIPAPGVGNSSLTGSRHWRNLELGLTPRTLPYQRNSGPGESRCCSCGSSVRSCCGSPPGNSPRRCSNCRHGSPGSSPCGSLTANYCNTDCRNRQLLTPAPLANAVSADRRTCNSVSEISPGRSARASTFTGQRQRCLRHQATAARVAAPQTLPSCLRPIAPLTSPSPARLRTDSGPSESRFRSSGTSERPCAGSPPDKPARRRPTCRHGAPGPSSL
jgi:hypothetical protein